ncbi:MAG: hypothetical protein FJY88_11105 [Candidatus Eisenbacteria bacterium]|nr:hypothetical protein [Candidatus Eisenbacteria bacterium]
MRDRSEWNLPADTAAVGIEDLYKLLHQAYQGPGHAVPSREAASLYLREEWAELDPAGPDEELLDPLVQGSPFLRLNLRPFKDGGGSIDSLLDAFVRSAGAPIDSTGFARAWQSAASTIEGGGVPWSIDEYRRLDERVRPLGYPAIHHSDAYERRFRPAYRVLSRPEAERLIATLAARGKNAR